MRVLILAIDDWANMGNILTKCLVSVGVNAKLYVENRSRGRLKEGESLRKEEAIKFAKLCDIIQYMHSVKSRLPINFKGKKVVVFHGGSKYRRNSRSVCREFNPIVDCSLIQTYDLYGLGAKNEVWLLPPIDTDNMVAKYDIGKKIIVGHYPSSSKVKGSERIKKIIDSIKGQVPDFEYRYSYEKVPWRLQLERVRNVDIYIEMMSLKQIAKGNKGPARQYGHWGMSALEGAAMGKIVVTNFFGHKEYKKQYGKCALQVANSEKEMRRKLIKLLSSSKEDLLKLKIETRHWAEKYHSYSVVGSKLRGIYENL